MRKVASDNLTILHLENESSIHFNPFSMLRSLCDGKHLIIEFLWHLHMILTMESTFVEMLLERSSI
jgi:hypothetical protein